MEYEGPWEITATPEVDNSSVMFTAITDPAVHEYEVVTVEICPLSAIILASEPTQDGFGAKIMLKDGYFSKIYGSSSGVSGKGENGLYPIAALHYIYRLDADQIGSVVIDGVVYKLERQ